MGNAPAAPLTFDDLRLLIEQHRFGDTSRCKNVHARYERHKTHVNRYWKTHKDYLLHSIFGLKPGFDGVHRYCYQSPTTQTPLVVLRYNDFGYNIEEGVWHFVLWKRGGDQPTPQEILDATGQLATMFGAGETLHFVNPPHLQSVPVIQHAHILHKPHKPRVL